MIELIEVSKSFNGRTVLKDISLKITEGETMVLIGPSGSGKTTLLKMINKLILPETGRIMIANENIQFKDSIQLRRKLGYVIQEIGLFPHLTLYKNITIMADILSWPENKIKNKVSSLQHLLNIENIDLTKSYPDEISGGQRQRIGIARALMTDPDIILLDEPFGALDPITRLNIRKEFRQLEYLLKKTMVMVTHDVSEALELADHICVLHEGRILQTGTPEELLIKPENGFVTEFFKDEYFTFHMSRLKIRDLLSQIDLQTGIPGKVTAIDPDQNVFDTINDNLIKNHPLYLKVNDKEYVFSNAALMQAFIKIISSKSEDFQ